MQSGIITKSRSKLRNLLIGNVPTAALWDTPPSDLANVTDGNHTTSTGTGTKSTSGAGTVGTITFDLNDTPSSPLLLSIHAGVSVSNNNLYIYVDQSSDNFNAVTYNEGQSVGGSGSPTESKISIAPTMISERYFRIRFYTSAAATGTVKIYECKLFQL
jgi:hypothetical protein